MNDRRSAGSRCPICQGPTAANEAFPGGVKCRNSMCSHNYAKLACPRCGEAAPGVSNVDGDQVVLECKECMNHFKHKR